MMSLHPRATGALLALALFAACSGAEETFITGNALVSTADEAAGANCEFGGTAVSYGVDLNDNGSLDASEVASTSYVCADEAGGAPPLVATSAEPAGANCEFGGFAIASGSDANGDGSLGADEITETTYACASEPDPVPVPAPLGATTDEEPGDNCEFGGVRVDVGDDADGDGTLATDEISETSYICAEAAITLASDVTYRGEADQACAGGYVERAFGLDTDGDGTLDESEVNAAITTCNLAPGFAGNPVFFVDSCTDGGTFDLMPFDLDGSVAGVTVEVIRAADEVGVAVDADGILTLTGGTYTAGAIVEATVSDEFGIESTAHFTLVFNGEGCEPLNTFYGVDPDSCREIAVSMAGDDRGNTTLTPSWVYYNGDDALVRVDRGLLNSPEIVVTDEIDTLFHDNATEALYSLWSSTFEFDTVAASEGLLTDNGGYEVEAWDEIVALDEDTLTVTSTVTLVPPVGVANGDTFNFGTEAEPLNIDVNDVFVAMRAARLAVAVRGYSSALGSYVIAFRIYDASAGTLLHSWYVTDSDEAYASYDWDTQEVSLQHFPLWIVDDVEFVLLPTGDGWNRINLRDGSFELATGSFASDCDQSNVAFDVTGLRAYAHNEYGCWGADYDEIISVCDVLLVPNDGSIDDSGESAD